MMLNRPRGIGQTDAPPVCTFPGTMSDPFCIDAWFSGEYMPGYTDQVAPMITAAQVQGAAPVVPSDALINSANPQDTINYILSQSQTNANTAAVAAAAAQAAANAAATPSACVGNPNSFSCWIAQNQTTLLIGGGLFLGLYALSVLKK